MAIADLFKADIRRNINGVVKVADTDQALVEQELSEYVVTDELQRHFATFYKGYGRSLEGPTDKMGAWISGFFGSGKSHFLKMLSYLLSNPEVEGKRAVEYFDGKFDDPATTEAVLRAASVPTQTILFDIDSRAGNWKDGAHAATAVLRAFQCVFWESLGYYGQDLRLAKLEAHLDRLGKFEAFQRAFETASGRPWKEMRRAYRFNRHALAAALNETLGMTVEEVSDWLDETPDVPDSADEFAKTVKEYVDAKVNELGDFRLLFLADEMGQFIGDDSSMMLSLQSLAQTLGTECKGRVWVVVTSQQAIDKVTEVRDQDFSKIQGRFDTRISLSSADADEVIKERVLAKTDRATEELAEEYRKYGTVLKNLFTFEDSTSDMGSYLGAEDFERSYPFVGYQFKLVPQVFTETRTHGHSGSHLASGERSMLSAFKESAEVVAEDEVGTLVPFWRFYDTLETALEHNVRQVVTRTATAAEHDQGLEPFDVEVLKTLYLVRYIEDVKATAGNVATLMVDSVDCDKAALRERVSASLERLVAENKAARIGERYQFLTSEEQDVAKEIRRVEVDAAEVVDRVKKILFDGGVLPDSKHRVGQSDFPVDRFVDGSPHGRDTGAMRMEVITSANPLSEMDPAALSVQSAGRALVRLAEGNYYDLLESVVRMDKYVRTSSQSNWTESKRQIVRLKQEESQTNERAARDALRGAVSHATLVVDGRVIETPERDPKKRVDEALDALSAVVYNKAGLVDTPVAGEGAARQILRGEWKPDLPLGVEEANAKAKDEVRQYLLARARTMQPESVGNIQQHFQDKPYGWREEDIAGVLAQLIREGFAAVSLSGRQLGVSDERETVEHLRGRKADSAKMKVRKHVDPAVLARARSVIGDATRALDVPGTEDEFVAFAEDSLRGLDAEVLGFLGRYGSRPYPGRPALSKGHEDLQRLLGQTVDPFGFVHALSKPDAEDDLMDLEEALGMTKGFFEHQKGFFDDALDLLDLLTTEEVYLEGSGETQKAIQRIEEIVGADEPYRLIHELSGLVGQVRAQLKAQAQAMRGRLLDDIEKAESDLEAYATAEGAGVQNVMVAKKALAQELEAQQSKAHRQDKCSQLDAQRTQLERWVDRAYKRIDSAVAEAKRAQAKPVPKSSGGSRLPVPKPKEPKVLKRDVVCPTKVLRTAEEVNEYVENIRQQLFQGLQDNGSVRLG